MALGQHSLTPLAAPPAVVMSLYAQQYCCGTNRTATAEAVPVLLWSSKAAKMRSRPLKLDHQEDQLASCYRCSVDLEMRAWLDVGSSRGYHTLVDRLEIAELNVIVIHIASYLAVLGHAFE
ncbi:hypothetical protein BKA93DRAFT_752710 [Sparassis latifolia]